MNEDPATQLLAVQDGPPATRARVGIDFFLPRELEPILLMDTVESAVESATNRSKLEEAKSVGFERNVAWNDQVDIVRIPLIHLDDAPFAQERVATLGHCVQANGLANRRAALT